MSLISNCCGYPAWNETDLCGYCKEHADFYDEEEEEKEDMIDFRKEAEILCKELEVPNKVYREYLANKLEMMYVKGKLDITQEFKMMRDNDED